MSDENQRPPTEPFSDAAFDAFFRNYHAFVSSRVRHRVMTPADAHWVVDKVFAAIYRKWKEKGFYSSKNAHPFLKRVIEFKMLHYWRYRARHMVVEAPEFETPFPDELDSYFAAGAHHPPDKTIEEDQRFERLIAATTKIPDRIRPLFDLVVFGGMKIVEAARTLVIPVNTAHSWMREARIIIREELARLNATKGEV